MAIVNVGKTNLAILRGELDLSVWSEEELIRGQRRASNGRFMGRPPKVVPKAIHDELVRRKMSRAFELLQESVVDAALLLRSVVNDPEAAYAERIRAASLILDRVLGKTPERIQLEVEPPWATALRQALTERPPTGIISLDADSWEEDEN